MLYEHHFAEEECNALDIARRATRIVENRPNHPRPPFPIPGEKFWFADKSI
jgi:hypothetical protein